jgi:hypothetical protein
VTQKKLQARETTQDKSLEVSRMTSMALLKTISRAGFEEALTLPDSWGKGLSGVGEGGVG